MGQRLSLAEREPMPELASHLLEDCRTVLPGIQALFGLQLVAVFNGKFWELSYNQRVLHLMAIALVAISVAQVMTPTAYHRQAHQFSVTRCIIPERVACSPLG